MEIADAEVRRIVTEYTREAGVRNLERELATAYRQATGRELTDPATQLEIQALIFRADGNPGVRGGAAACGRHRCAQFMIQTPDDLLVNLFPVIDLSAGRVVSRTGDFS